MHYYTRINKKRIKDFTANKKYTKTEKFFYDLREEENFLTTKSFQNPKAIKD